MALVVTLSASYGAGGGVVGPLVAERLELALRDQTERGIHQIADTEGGVILGRAAAIVLREQPRALHVRLDGPVEARIQRLIGFEGMDEIAARKALAETDRAWEGYVKHFYKCDARAAAHYHLVLDS